MTRESEHEKIGGLKDWSKELTDILENKNLSFEQFKEQTVLKHTKCCRLELQ